jgi:hypothetical protein
MTVKELIEKLSKYNEDTLIGIDTEYAIFPVLEVYQAVDRDCIVIRIDALDLRDEVIEY